MSCVKFVEAIVDHAYGAPLPRHAGEHLAACSECRRLFESHSRQARDIDATVERVLAIEPSIGFQRGVRQRIERRGAAGSHTLAWSASVCAAVVLLIAALGALRERSRVSPSAPAISRAAADIRLSAPVPPVAPEGTAGMRPHRRGTRRAAAGHVEARSVRANREIAPAVLVPANQRRAIARFLELLEDGTLDAERLPRPDLPGGKLADLVIAPLKVEPIVIRNVEVSGRPERESGRP